jgi:hypothetical protein
MKRIIAVASVMLAWLLPDAWGQTYQSVLRQPDGFVGFIVSFRGQVVQSVQNGTDYMLRVNVTHDASGTWNDSVLVDYRGGSGQPRIIAGTIIDFRGKIAGSKSYDASGELLQVPYVVACDVRAVIKANIRTVPRPCN